jgi:hypothetical protein
VQSHLTKIAADYVCPDKGSAEFAIAYVPSEAVYYFLVHEGYDLLRTFARRGVQASNSKYERFEPLRFSWIPTLNAKLPHFSGSDPRKASLQEGSLPLPCHIWNCCVQAEAGQHGKTAYL